MDDLEYKSDFLSEMDYNLSPFLPKHVELDDNHSSDIKNSPKMLTFKKEIDLEHDKDSHIQLNLIEQKQQLSDQDDSDYDRDVNIDDGTL